jgi:hypothetical protein
MGAQDGKKVWFETASFWQLLKYFFKFALKMFIIGCVVAYISTRFFNWDYMVLAIHIQYWYVLPPSELVIVFGSVALWNWSRTSEKKKHEKQLMREAGGEKQK